MKTIGSWVLFALLAAATVQTFRVPNAPAFQDPELARMIFFHLPCAILATVFLFTGAYHAFKFLKARDPVWDVRSLAANEIGLLLSVLTMITGILFSKVQWGAWWQWDPRQTSFLMVLLLYSAYFALRGALSDPDRRSAHSAAYAVAMVLPTMFLIFVFPRLPQVQSFHPSNTVVSGGFDRNYGQLIVLLIAGVGVISVWLYRLRVRAGLLLLEVESDGQLDARGAAAGVGVVRPVSVPPQD